jgi:hypothetical protein
MNRETKLFDSLDILTFSTNVIEQWNAPNRMHPAFHVTFLTRRWL